MTIRDRLKRLERQSGVLVHIPQPDGPPARFPQSALADAFLTTTRRLCGEDVAAHPLGLSAARSQDATWANSFYADDGSGVTSVEDLSK